MDRVLDPKCFSFYLYALGRLRNLHGLGVTDDGEVCPDCGGERLNRNSVR